MYYCEFAENKYARFGTMLPVEQALSRDIGYCSLFWFKKEDALEIRKRGNSKGFKDYAVYAEWLWIDIDDECLETAKIRFEEIVKHFKGFRLLGYFSGSKGYHLGIQIEPMFGRHVPYSHKVFLQDRGLECDESLYQHGRLFRNIGSTHEKTGNVKVKVLDEQGDTLNIPTVIEQYKETPIFTEGYSEPDMFRDCLMRAISIIERSPSQGMRHTTLWSYASNLVEAGATYELAYQLALYLNSTFTHPKDEEEVENAVRQAYGNEGNLLAGSTSS